MTSIGIKLVPKSIYNTPLSPKTEYLDDITTKNDHKYWSYKKLIIGPSGSGKTNYLLNSVQKDNNVTDKIYLYAKDLEEPKYQLLIKKREQARIKF